jgi:hypothetical protein
VSRGWTMPQAGDPALRRSQSQKVPR